MESVVPVPGWGFLDLAGSRYSLFRKEIAVVTHFSEAQFFASLFRGDLDILMDRIVKVIPVFCAQSL